MVTEIKAGMEFGRYRLERCLSRGGAGGVWVARDTRLGRKVAVKLLPRLLVTDEDAEHRFFRGARALSRLQHPNVVTLFDIGSADPGSGEEVPFLVMEFIEGKGLDQIIEEGPPAVDDGLRIMVQVARAMAAAHENGVVHRDLKPANIVVSPEGHATVLDFGLARLMQVEGQTIEATITAPGMVLGSCPYMAPEQALGRAVDDAADIFSFGVVLYEVVSGQRAFRGPNPVLAMQSVIRGEYLTLDAVAPHTPPAVQVVVERCMERAPEDRYPNAEVLVGDLEAILDELQGRPDVDATPTDQKMPMAVHERMSDASSSATESGQPSGGSRVPAQTRLSRGKRTVFVLLTTLLVWMVCEAIVVIGAPRTLAPVNTIDPQALVDRHREAMTTLVEGRADLFTLSSKLGWSYKPFGRKGIYRANGQGIRADREYAVEPPEGVVRVASFGDSFMYGVDVAVQDTWQARLEEMDQTIEALNFGVSGYGTDQALLRYLEEGRSYAPDVVVLSYMSENNLRNLTTFRPFYLTSTGLPFGKPRFRLEGDELILVENPLPTPDDYRKLMANPEEVLPRVGENDVFYEQYESSSVPILDRSPTFRALKFWVGRLSRFLASPDSGEPETGDWYLPGGSHNPLLFRMIDTFFDEAEVNGSRALIMLFPTHFDYRDHAEERRSSYANVADFLEAQGFPFIDVGEVFDAYLESGGKPDELFAFGAKGGHYSPRGQQLIADAMHADFLAHELDASTRESDAAMQVDEPGVGGGAAVPPAD